MPGGTPPRRRRRGWGGWNGRGGGDASPQKHAGPLFDYLPRGVHDVVGVLNGRAVAHEADAPGFGFEGAQAAADLDVELVQEALAHGEVVDAVGDLHGVEHGEVETFL